MQDSRRREDRKSVVIPALFFVEGNAAQRGIVCDLTSAGAFLQPLGRLPLNVDIGSRMRVVFFAREPEGERKIDLIATVRWAGKSPAHDCAGLGLEFNDNPVGKTVDLDVCRTAAHG